MAQVLSAFLRRAKEVKMLRVLKVSALLLVSLSNAAQTQLSQSQFNELWGPVETILSEAPLTFGPAITQDGVTLVETDEGRAALSFSESGGEITVETQGDIYKSSVDNLGYSMSPSGSLVSGENLQFSSSTSDTTSSIDKLSFGGNSTEFQFELQNFDTDGPTNWGGEQLSFSRSSEGQDNLSVTNLYVRKEDGSFVEVGQGTYSSDEKKIQLTSVVAEQDGMSLSADQISLMQNGDEDLGNATNIYISDESGQFISIGNADIAVSPDQSSLEMTGLVGNADGYSFSAESLDIIETENDRQAEATNVFIQNASGDYVQIGSADYSEANKTLNMTSLMGEQGSSSFSADQLTLMQEGNKDIGQGTNLFIADSNGDFISLGTANVEVQSGSTTLSMDTISGESSGYSFAADTFNYSESNGNEVVAATGVFIKNANGDFVQIGEADYSSSGERLNLTSIVAQREGVDLSADQMSLFRQGNTDIGAATNLFISDGDNGFISVGTAGIELSDNGNSLTLNSISGETSGYSFSASHLSAESIGDSSRIGIEDGVASSITSSETLSFGCAVIDSDGDRTSGDFRSLSFANDDMTYSSERLRFSSDGDSVDLNTRGTLRASGKDLDVAFEATGVNNLSFGGPADDGGILIERNNDGRVTRAEGVVSLGTTDDGGISEVGVALGDAISFRATDADGNARELTASFRYDEAAGKFYLRTIFKNGDQTEIKVMPFTFTSEKVGEDAVAALSASIDQQNIGDYLNTMSGIIDLDRINDFIAVGKDRMQVRLGRDRGMEFYYANNSLSIMDGGEFNHGRDDTDLALSLGFFNRGADNSVRSGGVLLSSDSSLKYNVEAGQLSFGGVDLPDRGEIPLTLGAYYRYEDDDGTAIFGTLGTSLADLGSLSAGVAVEQRLSDRLSSTVGLATNTERDVAVNVGFSIALGRINNSNRSLSGNSFYDPRAAGEMARSLRDYSSTKSQA